MVYSKKRSSAKKRADKKLITRANGAAWVGKRVRVYWPMAKAHYAGVVESFDRTQKKHTIKYNDGDTETINLNLEMWGPIDESESEEISTEEDSDAYPEPSSWKRARSNGSSSANGKNQMVVWSAKSKSPEPGSDRNGNLGNIVAAASRMSTRSQTKARREQNVSPRLLRSGKKLSESDSPKQKGPSSAAVSKKVKKPRTSLKEIKSSDSDGNTDVPDSDGYDASVEADAEDASEEAEDEDASEEAEDEDASEESDSEDTSSEATEVYDYASGDDSETLMSFLMKNTPKAAKALKRRMKRMKRKEEERVVEEEESEESS